MPLPAGIPTIPCSIGVGFGLEDVGTVALGVIVKVESSVRGLVWAATGDPGVSDPYTITVAPGSLTSSVDFSLIPTDLAGWLLNGAPVDASGGKQSHTYTISVQWTKAQSVGTIPVRVGAPFVWRNLVVPQATAGTLDLDRAPSTSDANGTPIVLPPDFGGAVDSVNGHTGAVVLSAADVGAASAADIAAEATARANADTAEATARANADALLAPLASPVLSGTPTTPTATPGANTLQIANTAFVAAAVAALINAAPGALDTLKELADAIGDDANFAATVTNALATKQPLDADLTAIAALSTTAYGRGLLALADAAALRSAAALGTLATQSGTFSGTSSGTNTGDQDLSGLASRLNTTAVKTANYTAGLWDLVRADTSGGSFTVTLPAASGGKGMVAVKLTTAGNTLNLALTGTDHFNTSSGPTTGTLTLVNQGVMAVSDGSGVWTITADDLPLSVLDGRYVLASMVAAKGDLIVGTGAGTVARLAAGTDGQQPVADSSQAGGLAYRTIQAETRGMKSQRYYLPQHYGTLGSSSFTNLTIGRLYACGILRPRSAVTLDRWAYFVDSVAGTTGTILRAGLWLVGDDGMPGSLAFDLGSSAADVINTEYQVTCSAALRAGVEYVLGVVPQVGTTGPKLKVADRASCEWGTESANGNQLWRFAGGFGLASDGVTGTLGAWPTTYVTGNMTTMPLIGVRAA